MSPLTEGRLVGRSVLHVITDTDRRGAQIFGNDLHTAMVQRGLASEICGLVAGKVGGLNVPTLGNRSLSIRTLWRLRQAMSAVDLTVAHGSTCVFACALGRLLGGGPFVVRQISQTSFWVNSRPKKLRVWAALQLSRRIVCLTSRSALDLIRTTHASATKIRLAPNGVDAHSFINQVEAYRGTARQHLALKPDEFVVLSIGALTPEKGVDAAIRAVAALPFGTLLIVGEGPVRPSLEALAVQVKCDRTIFAGSMKEPALAFAAADLVVLSSTAGDSMPAVLIEAGLAGLPSVATDVGSVRDTVVDGLTGLIVEAGDTPGLVAALSALHGDEDLRRFLGSNAQKFCLNEFDIAKVTDIWIDILDASIGN